ncbi:MAG: hypothetical protein MHM6MM_002061 [Cercozoa sp. M6MM]
MTEQLTYHDDLWDKFEEVAEHLSDGRHDIKHLDEFMRKRADIEKQYARALRKLASQMESVGIKSPSTVSSLIDDIRNSTESVAKEHEEFGEKCRQIAVNEFEELSRNMKENRNLLKKKHSSQTSEVSKCTSKHEAARSKYLRLVEQRDRTIQERDELRRSLEFDERLLQKLEKKLANIVKDVRSAKQSYADAVEDLRVAQQKLDEITEEGLRQMETMERERLNALLRAGDGTAHALYSLHANALQNAMLIQRGLRERANREKDIFRYVHLNQSSLSRPDYVRYEPCPDNDGNIPLAEARVAADDVAKQERHEKEQSEWTLRWNTRTLPDTVPLPEFQAFPDSVMDSDVTENKRSSLKSTQWKAGDYGIVVFDLGKGDEDDLEAFAGEVVRLVSPLKPEESSCAWWMAETVQGSAGLVPTNYLTRVTLSPDCSVEANASKLSWLELDQNRLRYARCVCDFAPRSKNEVGLKRDQIVDVVGVLPQAPDFKKCRTNVATGVVPACILSFDGVCQETRQIIAADPNAS